MGNFGFSVVERLVCRKYLEKNLEKVILVYQQDFGECQMKLIIATFFNFCDFYHFTFSLT